MLFYPDQYFYSNGPQRASRRSSTRRSQPVFAADASDDDYAPAWSNRYRSQAASPRPQRQQVPEEYIVLDEDELNALRAFREAKRRTSQREQYERAQLARRKAEAERKARETARRETEARLQAQIEANARAAAREYLRRQQARQQAILEAQQAERERQQRFVMEQLRQQFGLFAVPTSTSFQAGEEPENEQEQQQQQEQQVEDALKAQIDLQQRAEAQDEDVSGAGVTTDETGGQDPAEARAQREQFDPIRSLIEALAPYPFIIATESSDEEQDDGLRGRQQQSEESSEDDAEEAENVNKRTLPRSVEVMFEPEVDLEEGPTCETASDESEPVYVEEPEFRVFSAAPPVPEEYDSGEEIPSLKDRRKERQGSAPVDHLKKAKTKDSKKEAKKERKERKERKFESKQKAPRQATSDEIGGLLSALADELQKLKDAYERLSNAKPTSDLREVISRLEAVKIGYGRSEEIYNKLDEVRAGKEGRKQKHEITTEAVALADKYERLLGDVYAEKKSVSLQNSRSGTPKVPGDDLPDKSSVSPDENSPKHQVVLEEVRDESDN